MQTQAYFENIQQEILKELEKAQQSIYIAVAWFTDNRLFDMLLSKAASGIPVELILMNDEINNNCGIDFNLLANKGGKVWKIGSGEANDTLMHNKFCVIDSDTVINGSYNWTRKAKQNHESITVITENAELAVQFIAEFHSIKEKYFGYSDGATSSHPDSIILDYGKICIRLETLKNAILLEDKEDIAAQLKKIKAIVKPANKESNATLIHDILLFAEKRQYGDAVRCINEFTTKFKSLTVYVDTELAALKLELRGLELQLSSLEDEKAEIEKTLHDFEIRHNRELGEIILKILFHLKKKLKEEAANDKSKEQEYKEAEKDYDEFNNNYASLKDEKINELIEEDKKDIKNLFRKASKLCHPDKVSEEQQEEAERIFKELNNAYKQNDLKKVKDILTNLEKGIFLSKSDTVNEKAKLLVMVNQLRLKRDLMEEELNMLKASETYKTIATIDDWDEYFKTTKEKLSEQLKELETVNV